MSGEGIYLEKSSSIQNYILLNVFLCFLMYLKFILMIYGKDLYFFQILNKLYQPNLLNNPVFKKVTFTIS